MGRTGEPDRKRRHFSSISPTAASAKKHPFFSSYEDKKIDTAVHFQNQKLVQKLETQKAEHSSLENKFTQLKESQQPYDSTLKVVNKSWEELITDLVSCSMRARESSSGQDSRCISSTEDVTPYPSHDAFLSRLMETGATESSSTDNCLNQMEEDRETGTVKTKNILCNIVAAVDNLWHLRDGLYATFFKDLQDGGKCFVLECYCATSLLIVSSEVLLPSFPSKPLLFLGSSRQKASNDLSEVKNLRSALSDLHLKHKSLARKLQGRQDIDAKDKAELKRLKGELESAVTELGECNCKLAALRAERDVAKGAFFPVLNRGNKHVAGDRVRDVQRDLRDMESVHKELMDQALLQLLELEDLHDERIKTLQQLYSLQNTLKSLKGLSSSQAFLSVKNQNQKFSTTRHYSRNYRLKRITLPGGRQN